MIDRRTVRTCATLIVLMLGAAVLRIAMPEDWTGLAIRHRVAMSWLPFVFPLVSAFVVGALYWRHRGDAEADRVQRWRAWGASVSISYCAILLLLQTVFIAISLGFGMHFHLGVIYRALGVLLAIMVVMATNQMPKLPYLEHRFAFDLGPIYGPRYVRAQSRIVIAFMAVVIAYFLAATPSVGWRPAIFILLAFGLQAVCGIAWRRHLSRKWKLEQLASAHR